MKRTLNILLVVGCVLSVTTAFWISVKPAGTISPAAAPASPMTVPPPLPSLDRNVSTEPSIGIGRELQLHTHIPDPPFYKVTQYTVKRGDSLWSIAQQFNLEPETLLWSNEELNGVTGVLNIGDTLNILPVDGVLHTAQEGDTLQTLEELHGTPAEEIVEFFGNDFDLTQPPQLTPGQQIIVPDGSSPILWSEAYIPNVSQIGSGGSSSNIPNLGTGYFVWPVNGYVFTQEYWSGHPGIDLATAFRQPVFAADSGTVTFSGWDDTGYGYFIIIDHGNGFKTTYGHNEANLVAAGQTVVKGQQIAESGKSGNSTGNHLDFRILLNGSFVNPLGYLP